MVQVRSDMAPNYAAAYEFGKGMDTWTHACQTWRAGGGEEGWMVHDVEDAVLGAR